MRESIVTVLNLPASSSHWMQNWHMMQTNRCELWFRIGFDILFIIFNSDLKIDVSRSLNNNIGQQSALLWETIWQLMFPGPLFQIWLAQQLFWRAIIVNWLQSIQGLLLLFNDAKYWHPFEIELNMVKGRFIVSYQSLYLAFWFFLWYNKVLDALKCLII